MFRYNLRTLLLVLTLGPPLFAALWLYAIDMLHSLLAPLLPLLVLLLGILAVEFVALIFLATAFAPGIAVFYTASAVIRRFRKPE